MDKPLTAGQQFSGSRLLRGAVSKRASIPKLCTSEIATDVGSMG